MAFKLIDFRCDECGHEMESLVDVPHDSKRPTWRSTTCKECGSITRQSALIGLPAPYMGERVCNPQQYGGPCDTMGHKEPPPLPDLHGASEHRAKLAERMRDVPNNAPRKEAQAAFAAASHDAPSSADYATLFASKEYKSAEAERTHIQKQNEQKRARASAIAKGENINMKRDKCAGDPNLAA